jgi:hypothetical protein
MTESKFIELLNLYVDHQISAADAAQLEAEIHRNPERCKIYRQYCQMQKACSLLADNFRTEAPAPSRADEWTPAGRRFAPFGYAMGAVAAAACLALVQVFRSPSDEVPTPTAIVAAVAAPAAAPQAAPSPTGPVSLPARVALQPAFAGFESAKNETNLHLADSRVQLDWMDRVQLRRVTTEEIWLQPRPMAQPNDLLFRNSRAFYGPAEGAAWRFQK